MTIRIAIIFGGKSSEHRESIKTTKLLYKNIIGDLSKKYELVFFYLTQKNQWTTKELSISMIKGDVSMHSDFTKNIGSKHIDSTRMLELKKVDVIYNTMMGDCGENGNIMGLADLFGVPMAGCGILASALCADKHLSKLIAKAAGINIVDFLLVDRNDINDTNNIKKIASKIKNTINYPCFVKPTNLGTCAYVFRAENETELIEKFTKIFKKNDRSDQYLVEKFLENSEVRIFTYEDENDEIHTNDAYVTRLNYEHLDGDSISLFKHLDNKFSSSTRNKIKENAKKLFKIFNLKDYARIDFFVGKDDNEIHFNEINTHPFIGSKNIQYMKNDGLTYTEFFKTIVKRNIE